MAQRPDYTALLAEADRLLDEPRTAPATTDYTSLLKEADDLLAGAETASADPDIVRWRPLSLDNVPPTPMVSSRGRAVTPPAMPVPTMARSHALTEGRPIARPLTGRPTGRALDGSIAPLATPVSPHTPNLPDPEPLGPFGPNRDELEALGIQPRLNLEGPPTPAGATPLERQLIAGSPARQPLGPVQPGAVPAPTLTEPTLLEEASDITQHVNPTRSPVSRAAQVAVGGLTQGVGGIAKGIGGTIEWAGAGAEPTYPHARLAQGSADLINAAGDFLIKAGMPADEQTVQRVTRDFLDDPMALTDPQWWAFNLGSGAGSQLAFLVPMIGTQAATAGIIGKIASATPRLAKAAELIGGAGAGTVVESAVEAGLAYRDAIEAGASPEQASEAAAYTARENLKMLAATNAAGYVMPGVANAGVVRRLLSGFLAEGAQEGFQAITSGTAAQRTYDPARDPFEGAATEALIGGVVGGGTGAVLGGEIAASDRQRSPGAIADGGVTVEDVAALVEQMTPEERAQFGIPDNWREELIAEGADLAGEAAIQPSPGEDTAGEIPTSQTPEDLLAQADAVLGAPAGTGLYTGPERRGAERVSTPQQDALYNRIREKLARGEELGSDDLRAMGERQSQLESSREAAAKERTPVEESADRFSRRDFFKTLANAAAFDWDEYIADELMGDPELVMQSLMEVEGSTEKTPGERAAQIRLTQWLVQNGLNLEELRATVQRPLADRVREAADQLGLRAKPTPSVEAPHDDNLVADLLRRKQEWEQRQTPGDAPATGEVTDPEAVLAEADAVLSGAGPEPIVFRSGNQRAPSDFDGYAKAGQPVGVTADMSPEVRQRVVDYIQQGGHVFVDSGAFGTPDPSFSDIMDRYRELADALDNESRARLSIVMPDKVGDAKRTRELQAQWRNWAPQGVRTIWPVQVSESVVEDAVATFRANPTGALGFPANKAAMPIETLRTVLDALKAVNPDYGGPRGGFHLLGMGERNRNFDAYVQAIREVFPNAVISSDSNRTRALMAPGRPADSAVKDLTESRAQNQHIDADPDADTTELTGAFFRGERNAFRPAEIEQLAAALNVSPDELRQAMTGRRVAELVDASGLEAALDVALYKVAHARASKTARPGARTDVIAEFDKKDTPPVEDEGAGPFIARDGKGQTRRFRDSLEASVWNALHSTDGHAERIAQGRLLDDEQFAQFVREEIGISGGGRDGYSYEVKPSGEMIVTGPKGRTRYKLSQVAKVARRLLDEHRPITTVGEFRVGDTVRYRSGKGYITAPIKEFVSTASGVRALVGPFKNPDFGKPSRGDSDMHLVENVVQHVDLDKLTLVKDTTPVEGQPKKGKKAKAQKPAAPVEGQIGTNVLGDPLYETPDGVRYVIRDGKRITDPEQYPNDESAQAWFTPEEFAKWKAGDLSVFEEQDDGEAVGPIDPSRGWADRDQSVIWKEGPAKRVVMSKLVKGETLTLEQAEQRKREWLQAAKEFGQRQDNSNKVVFFLFENSGVTAAPWIAAGFDVRAYDIKAGDDLMRFFPMADIMEAREAGKEIFGVFAMPPCTSFAVSGARWWQDQHDKADVKMLEKKYGWAASRFFDTPIEYANALVAHAELFIEEAQPTGFFAMENPVGRIAEQNKLPEPTLTFEPHHFGEPYTKKTILWGRFNPQLPTANVEPAKGSYIHVLRGDDPVQKELRSTTPEGFALAFFMANSGVQQQAAAETPKPAADLSDEELAAEILAEYEAEQASAKAPETPQADEATPTTQFERDVLSGPGFRAVNPKGEEVAVLVRLVSTASGKRWAAQTQSLSRGVVTESVSHHRNQAIAVAEALVRTRKLTPIREQDEAEPEAGEPLPKGHTYVGDRLDGTPLYADAKGVRYFLEGTTKSTEAVQLIAQRGGMTYGTDRTLTNREYLTAEEVARLTREQKETPPPTDLPVTPKAEPTVKFDPEHATLRVPVLVRDIENRGHRVPPASVDLVSSWFGELASHVSTLIEHGRLTPELLTRVLRVYDRGELQNALEKRGTSLPADVAPVTPKSEPMGRGDAMSVSAGGITVAYNQTHNGIQIKFKDKPSPNVLEKLKSAGFRWSKPQKLWYRKVKMSNPSPQDIADLVRQFSGMVGIAPPVEDVVPQKPAYGKFHGGATEPKPQTPQVEHPGTKVVLPSFVTAPHAKKGATPVETETAITITLTPAQRSALEVAGLTEFADEGILTPAEEVLLNAWDGNKLVVTPETRDALYEAVNDRSNAEDAQYVEQGDQFARRASVALGNLATKILKAKKAPTVRYAKGDKVEFQDYDGKWYETEVVSDTTEDGTTGIYHPTLRMQAMWPPGAAPTRAKISVEPGKLRPVQKALTPVEQAAETEGTHYFDSLYRTGEPRTTHPFLARSIMDMDRLGSDAPVRAYHGVRFDNPLVVESKAAASLQLLGTNVYEGLRATVGEVSEASAAILKADERVGAAAAAAGYDAVVTPYEVQVIDVSKLPPAEGVRYDEAQGHFTDESGQVLFEGIGREKEAARARAKGLTPVEQQAAPGNSREFAMNELSRRGATEYRGFGIKLLREDADANFQVELTTPAGKRLVPIPTQWGADEQIPAAAQALQHADYAADDLARMAEKGRTPVEQPTTRVTDAGKIFAADTLEAKQAELARQRDALAEKKAANKAKRDELARRLAARHGTTLRSGVDPQDLVDMVGIVRTYIDDGVIEFRLAWLTIKEEYPKLMEKLPPRLFELAWKRLRDEDRRVADLGPEAQNTVQEQGDGVRDARPGELPVGGSGTPVAGGTGRAPALGAVPADAVPPTASAGPERAGDGRAGGVVADGVSDQSADGPQSEPASAAGGGIVPGRALAPAGDVSDPGLPTGDYALTPERVQAIVDRGAVTRARDNLAAIRTIKAIMDERRRATPAEQEILAKYVGWGDSAVAKYLDETLPHNLRSNSDRALWQELHDATTEQEREALRHSSLNAHYTFDLYRPIWNALEKAGFTGGRVLEPAVGTGHAFGFMPPQVRANSTLVASELEPLTAAMAQALYPSARIQAVGYQEARVPRGTQDIVISNVPFGDYGVTDDRMPRYLTERIHNYFFARALDHVRPGGLIVFVTSRYTLDNVNQTAIRKYFAEKAHFLGAVRLPNTAFDQSAKSEVVTDIIVLQRLAEGEQAKNAADFIESPLNDALTQKTAYWERGKKKYVNVYRSQWYDTHPDLILGTEDLSGSMYHGGSYNVTAADRDLAPKIEAALAKILPPGSYQPASAEFIAAADERKVLEKGTFKTGEYRLDGKLLKRVDRHGELVDGMPTKADGTINWPVAERITAMVHLRDQLRTLRAAMLDAGTPAREIKKQQKALRATYDKFVKKYGVLNSTANRRAFALDPEVENLMGLELVKARTVSSTNAKGKEVLRVVRSNVVVSDIFKKRTLLAPRVVTHVDTAQDALVASLSIQTQIDWSYMASITGDHTVTPERIAALREDLSAAGRVFEQPDGSWVLAEEYLAGDVVSKLADVEAMEDPARFARNIEALRAVQPPAKSIEQITPALGANWIPTEFVAQFIADELGGNPGAIQIVTDSTTAVSRWQVNILADPAGQRLLGASRDHAMRVEYGGRDAENKLTFVEGVYSWLDHLDDALNLSTPTLGYYIDVPSASGKGTSRKFIKDETATLAARGNVEDIRAKWLLWVYNQGAEVQDKILSIYNARYNRSTQRDFNGAHLANYVTAEGQPARPEDGGQRSAALPGLALPFLLHPHQMRAVWRILTSGNTLLAHEVGAGKTFEMIIAAMEMRRTGRARKPLITVPTHLLSQWRADILRAYPGAKVLAFDEKDLESSKRQQAMARIAYGDWDIVLVPQSSFGLLKTSPQRMIDFLRAQVAELEAAEKSARQERGQDAGVKAMARVRAKLQEKIQKKLDAIKDKSQDDAIYWEELGVDALFVDEAHNFKNLFFFTNMENVRGLSRSESERALDLYIKIQDINQASNYRNIVLATATPLMNSMAEVYTMQRYLQPHRLEEQGFHNFDNWYRTFGEARPNTEQLPDGTYKEVMRLKKFRNLDLLYRTVSEVMDYVDWDMMPYLKLPKLEGDRVQIVETPAHPQYELLRRWFTERLAELRNNPPKYNHRTKVYTAPVRHDPITGESMGRFDNILTVMNDAKLAAIDARLVLGTRAKDFKDSRLQAVARDVVDVYKKEAKKRGVSLVFLDVGTPRPEDLTPLDFLANVDVVDDTGGDALGTEDADVDVAEDAEAEALDANGVFNLYGAFRTELIRRGIKPHEIAYIHQARNAAERLALFEAAQQGRIRVLIASSDKGGTGMNIQDRLKAIFHFDVPRAMRPGDIRQRDGRGIRQGNMYERILVKRYVTKGSTDEWLYGLLGSKQHAITEFMRGNLLEHTDEDAQSLSIEEAQARASNDPRVIELTELRSKIGRLDAQAQAAERAMAKAREDVARGERQLEQSQRELAAIEAWTTKDYQRLIGNAFSLDIDGQTFTKRADANQALIAKLKAVGDLPLERTQRYGPSRSEVQQVATVKGVKVMAYAHKGEWDREATVSVYLTHDAIGDHAVTDVAVPQEGAFGEGRDVTASLVAKYNQLGDEVRRVRRDIGDTEAMLARARKTLNQPTDVIQKAAEAKARIAQIEQELKIEGEAKAKEAEDEARAKAAERERKAQEKKRAEDERKLAEQQAQEQGDDEDDGGPVSAMPVRHVPRRLPAPKGSALPVTEKMRPSDLVRQIRRILGDLPVREKHFRHQAAGIYKSDVEEIRVRVANDLQTIFHEAGHGLDISVLGIPRKDKRWRDELYNLGLPTSRPSYTTGQVRKEGAAEFFRRFVLDPADAQRAAPNYFAEFEAQLANRPELQQALRDLRANVEGYLSQDLPTRLKLRIDMTGRGEPSGLRRVVKDPRGVLRDAAVKVVDDLMPLRDAVEQMRDGRTLAWRQNAYVLARLARGSAGKAQAFLEHGVRARNGKFISGSLADALTPVKDSLEDFAAYLVALRTLELKDSKKRPTPVETGITHEEAQATIARTEARADFAAFEQAREAVYQYQNALIEYARQYGALNEDQVAKMRRLNEFYVPFKRVMDSVESSWSGVARKIANRAVPVKRIKGSGRDIVNPFESMVVNTHAIVDMVEKNRAMIALTNLADRAQGSARWLTKIPPLQIPKTVNIRQVLEHAAGNDPAVADFLEAAGVGDSDVVTLFAPAFMGRPGEQIVTVIRNGRREFYQVNDERLYEAITRVGANLKTDVLAQFFEPFTKVLRAGATLTPEFISRNPARDTFVAFMQSRYGFIPGVDTIRGLIELVRGGEVARQFFASGIDQAALVGQDRARIRQNLKTLTGKKSDLVKYWARNPLEFLRALSSQMESATRLGEFKLALEAGGVERGVLRRLFTPKRGVTVDEETLTKAALAARDVTTDFSRGGQWTRDYNRYSAFLNARVQGYVRIGETIARDPVGALEKLTALMIVSAILQWWNHDDEEYQELPEWEKHTYWHIKVPGAAFFIRVPKPFEWGYAADLAEAGAAHVMGDRDQWQRFRPSDQQLLQAFVALAPTVFLPALEVAANYSTFRDRNIVSPFDLDMPVEEQYSDFTSEFAKKLAPRLGMSPAKFEHLFYGYTAGLGRHTVTYAVDPALGALGITPQAKERPSRDLHDLPVLAKPLAPVASVFHRDASFTSQAVSIEQFYDAYDRLTGAEQAIRRARAAGDNQKAAALHRKYRDEFGEWGEPGSGTRPGRFLGQRAEWLREGKRKIDEIRDAIDEIYALPPEKATPMQKREGLDRARAAMVSEARFAIGKMPLRRFAEVGR